MVIFIRLVTFLSQSFHIVSLCLSSTLNVCDTTRVDSHGLIILPASALSQYNSSDWSLSLTFLVLFDVVAISFFLVL